MSESSEARLVDFKDVLVVKPWGVERLVFDNGLVACWLLTLNAGGKTSLHCHPNKETAMILLNGVALVQTGLGESRTIGALGKTRFSAGYFHRHTGISDCDLLEVESPVDKFDLYRFRDEYQRAGEPYEGEESYRGVSPDDPQFGQYGLMTVGSATLRIVEFIDRAAFRRWAHKLPHGSIVVNLSGALRSKHGVEIVRLAHANWSQNIVSLLEDTEPDEKMQVLFISRDEDKKI